MNSGGFFERGYGIFEASNPARLDSIRDQIFQKAKSLVPYKNESVNDFFNFFHNYKLSAAELNKVRVDLVDYISQELKLSESIFEAFQNPIEELIGKDLVVQKVVNLVIQQPGDKEQAPVHRDAPLNSNFELIVWLPLVDVYRTKSMFILEKEKSLEGVKMLKAGKKLDEFCEYTENHASDLDVKYGSACFFQAGLAHGVHTNKENETRWSLNVRYKNLFSPYGSKGLAEFFQILNLSPFSKVAFDFDKLEHEIRENT